MMEISNWRRITDEQKDGNEYLLLWCGPIGGHQIGVWIDVRWETLDGMPLEDEFLPTHWMSLPDGPDS
jgi:hypothetical protein